MKELVTEHMQDILSYESTFGKPRFLGVPEDDRLIEESSLEGILHGRKISDVYAQDTLELTRAGMSWDDAVAILKKLAIACLHQEVRHGQIASEIERSVFGDFGYWDAPKPYRDRYGQEVERAFIDNAGLAGFDPAVKAYATGAKVQFDNPIREDRHIGDGSRFDLVAESAPEREIRFTGDDRFTSVVNFPTLRVAEMYHLLEKGNRYRMTGADITRFKDTFNESEFDRQLGTFMAEHMIQASSGLAAVPGHREELLYTDRSRVILKVGNYGFISILLSDAPFLRLTITRKEYGLSQVEIGGEDYRRGLILGMQDGQLLIRKESQVFGKPPTYLPVREGTFPDFVRRISEAIHAYATENPDGILRVFAGDVFQIRSKALRRFCI
jgi:hypothetical protein